MIRVLVHIEGKNRYSSRNALIMVRRDLVDEPSVTRNIGEQHPARTAGQSICNPDKFLTPAIDRTEVLRDGAREGIRQNTPVAAEACKVQFVQKCRIARHNLV